MNGLIANPILNTKNGAPVLGICWLPDQMGLLIASADNLVKKWDLVTNQLIPVGQHSQPVKDVYAYMLNGQCLMVSGGYDARVKFWMWAGPNQAK